MQERKSPRTKHGDEKVKRCPEDFFFAKQYIYLSVIYIYFFKFKIYCKLG